MLKKLKIISKIVEWVVFAFLLCFLFILLSPKLPIKNIPKSFIVVTGSMEPTIKTGSVAFVKNIDSKNIKVNDIIAFTSPSDPNDTILHRVNSVSSTDPLTFKTKGDNNNDIDAWDVPNVGVKGVYITAIPYLGNIASFIKKPLGFGLIIGIPALIFIIFQLLNIKKAISEEVDRKVTQKIAESKKSDSTKTILKSIIFFILFISTLFSLSGIHIIKAAFSDTVTISGISISIADFTKPSVPVLTSPIGFTNDTTPLMQWEDSTYYQKDVNIGYRYRVKYNCTDINDSSTCASVYPNNTGLWLNSSQYQAGPTNNGVSYWQVQSCVNGNNCSDWSGLEKVTIDSIYPTSTITLPVNSGTTSEIISQISNWSCKITGTATDNSSGVDRVELSIQDLDTSLFLSNTGWTSGTESLVRVDAVGITTWSYQINSTNPFPSNFKIVSHAIDKAGNIENSATIIFEYVATNKTVTPTVTPIPTTDINLSSNHSGNKINLEITNISSSFDYEILYTGNGIEKGIFGHINSDEIINSKYSKDFYLGTCSTGGTCTSEVIESGSIITVNLTKGVTLTKTFNY